MARVQAALAADSGRPADIIRELTAILAIDPKRADAHLLLGMAYRMTGSAEMNGEARAELVQALDLDPDLVPARFLLAQLYLDLGRPAGARDTLTAGLAQHSGQPQMATLLAEAERQLGHPERAIELARQALQADPSLLQARYYLALALVDAGRRDEAIRELEEVAAAGGNPADTNLALGNAYLDAGRLEAATSALGKAVAADPARADSHLALARAYRLRRLPDRARAQLALARPAVEVVSVADHPLAPVFYMELGLLDLQQGRMTTAAGAFQKVLEIDPGNEAAARHLEEARRRLRAGSRTPDGRRR